MFSISHIYYTLTTNPIDAIKDVYPTWRIIGTFSPVKYGNVKFSEHLNSVTFTNIYDEENYKDVQKWKKWANKEKPKEIILVE